MNPTKQMENLNPNLFLDNDFGSQLVEHLDPDLLRLIEEDYDIDES
jgi:hypothetical protein